MKLKNVKIGDWVCFKSDIEQCGKVVNIFSNGMLELYNESGFIGDYIAGDNYTDIDINKCWI